MLYRYCPQCGEEFPVDEQKRFQKKQDKISCAACPFVFYNNPVPGVAALIKNNKGEYLLAKRRNEPFLGYWDCPGGFVDQGELPIDAVRRELREEIGAQNIQQIKLVDMILVDYRNEGREEEKSQALTLIYEVDLKDMQNLRPGDDVGEIKFFHPCSFPEKIAFPEQRRFLQRYMKEKCKGCSS